jgi:PAS domain S-box-containing protein
MPGLDGSTRDGSYLPGDLARAVVEESPDAILIADDARRYVEANRAACTLLGYSRDELLSMCIDDVAVSGAVRAWEQLLDDGRLLGHTALRRKDGVVIAVEFRAKANVIPGCHLSVLRDATERLEGEQDSAGARELSGMAFDAAPVAMALMDATPNLRGIVRRVNAALAGLLGQEPHELVGQRLLGLFHPDGLQTAAAAHAAPPGTANRLPLALRRSDGTYVWAEITSSLVRGDEDDDYLLVMFEDTSGRRLAEAQLRDSEERFRTMVEWSTEGVSTLDDDDRVTFLNPRMAEMLAVGAEDLTGAPAAHLFCEEDHAALAVGLAGCRAGDRDRRELQLASRETGALPVIVSTTGLTEAGGNFSGTLMIVTDISARVAAEQQRALERTQLHDLQRLEGISRLAGGIGHDFNNLMGVILNYAAFVTAELDDRPDLRADLGEITTAARRSADLTRQLLTFSRQDVADPTLMDLGALLRRAETLLRPALQASVSISVDVPAAPCVIHADRDRIKRVLLNLAMNAGEAMPGGGLLAIELTGPFPESDLPRPRVGPGAWVTLRVRDEGGGMSPATLGRAFEPFFTTKHAPLSSGLGLASVYGIVGEHQGCVEVDSRVGEGTTFVIHLPVAGAAAAPAKAAQLPVHARVLLVEDERSVRDVSARILRAAGMSVIECDHPEAALARPEVGDGAVDVLLTDIRLPEMNGQRLTERVRERVPGVAVVFMSGFTEDPLAREAMQGGDVVFVGKPFSGAELIEGVRRAMAAARN